MHSPTILCVVDQPSTSLTLKTQLSRHFPNYAIALVVRGADALAFVDRLVADEANLALVIVDHPRPTLHGSQWLLELHARHPQILTLLLTEHPPTDDIQTEDIRHLIHQGGLYRCMAKPWHETDLLLTVTEALRRYHQEQQLQQQRQALHQAQQELAQLRSELEDQVQYRTQALQDSNERYRLLSEVSPVGIYHNDLNGQCTYANETTLQITGLSLAEIFGNGWAACIHPDDRERVYAAWQAFVQGVQQGQPTEYRIELQIVHPDGSIVWALTQAVPERNADGEITGFIGSLTDISDRKQIEEQLRRNEASLAVAQRIAHVGNWAFDVKTEKITWSEELFHVYGRSPNQPAPTYAEFQQQVHPEDWPILGQAVHEALTNGTPYELEHRIIQVDGSIRYVWSKGEAIQNEQGEVIILQGISQDITDLKRAEADAKLREQQLLSLLNNIPHMAWLKDSDGRFLAVNKTLEQAASLTASQLIGLTDLDLWPRELADSYRNDDRQVMESRQQRRYEERFTTVAGEEQWLETVKSPMFNDRGDVIGTAGIAMDITHRKQSEQILQELNEELERRVQERTQELQQQTQLLQTILNSLGDAVLVANTQGEIILQNPAAEQFIQLGLFRSSNYPPQNNWSIYLADGNTPCEIEQLPLERAIRGEALDQVEVILHHPSQLEDIYIETTVRPLFSDAHRLMGGVGVFRDISDRKQAEKRLQAESLRLQLALEAADMGTWESNMATGIWSERTEAIFGYAPGTFPGDRESFLQLIHADDQERVFQALSHSFATQSPYNIEYRIHRPDGALRWVAVRGKVVQGDAGWRMVGVAMDITDHKQAEESMRSSQEQLQLAVEGSGDGLWDWNIVTGDAYLSPRWFGILGYESYELAGHVDTWQRLIHPEDKPRIMEKLNAHLQDSSVPYHVEYRARTKTGDWKWLANYGKVVAWDAGGQPLRMVGLQRDITDRKQAETALTQSKARLQATFDQAAVGIVQADIQGRFIQVNQKFCEIVGYTEEEILFRSFAEITHPDDLTVDHANVQRGLRGEISTFTIEKRYIHKNGTIVWVLLAVSLVRNEVGEPEYFIGVVQDLNDRKQAEEALRQLNIQLEDRVEQRTAELKEAKETAEAANQAKSIFLANMSHELRTPLNAILGFSQLLNRDSSLTLDQQRQIAIINRSGEHLLNLINDILEVSKIEAGRVIVTLKNFDLQEMLRNLEELFGLKAKSKGITLLIQCDPKVPYYIRTDEKKLRQVLINLLGNAIKFTQSGRVILRVQPDCDASTTPQASLPIAPPQVLIRFEVEDTGVGIAENEQKDLFEPFMQTRSGQLSQEGTGLGLPISRQFVRFMGGEMGVSSVLGQGSTFRFTIPVDLATAAEMSPPLPDRPVIGLAPDQPCYRLLVVEDNPENRHFLVQLLQSVGFEVWEATNGREAITVWAAQSPHLIWMDIRMPIMDGYEATQQIRQLEHQTGTSTKILALTASAFEDERAAILAAGCDDFIGKPVAESVIFEKLVEYLGVRYVYQEQETSRTPEPQATAASHSISGTALRTMPLEWIVQLQRAARIADDELILQILDQLPADQSDLAHALQELVSELQLEQIIKLTIEAMYEN